MQPLGPRLDPAYESEIVRYRASRQRRLTEEDGWLSLVDKIFLAPGTTTLPIGSATVAGDMVVLRPAPDAGLTLDGAPVPSAELALAPREGGAAIVVRHGPLRYELVRRAGVFMLRVRDPRAPARRAFAGIPSYPIDPAWRVSARFVPHAALKSVEIAYDLGVARVESPGSLSFQSPRGQPGQLDALYDEDGGRRRLYILFGDATNRDETYGGGRFFYAPLPEDGLVPLDFNEALNPPCVFTPFATCPLPPSENRLAFRVDAGEKRVVYEV